MRSLASWVPKILSPSSAIFQQTRTIKFLVLLMIFFVVVEKVVQDLLAGRENNS